MNRILEEGLLAQYRGDPPTLRVRQAHGTRIDTLQSTAILTITVSFAAVITVSFVAVITVSPFATPTMVISLQMERVTMTAQSARRSGGHQRKGNKSSIVDTMKRRNESSERAPRGPKGGPTIGYARIHLPSLHPLSLPMAGP